jgi:hypothetical protein
MARIRSIKPEFWTDEDLSALAPETHLLAVALLNHADDEGYFKAHPKLVEAACRPLREDSKNVPGMLQELSRVGYIALGTGEDGKRYGHIRNFQKHQRVDKPSKSKIAELSITWDFQEDSENIPRTFQEDSCPELGAGSGEQGAGSGELDSSASEMQDERSYTTKKGRKLKGVHLDRFERFWEAFGYRKGKAEAADAWLDLKPDEATTEEIVKGAQTEARNRPSLIQAGYTPKMAQGWLTGRRWEDEDLGGSIVQHPASPQPQSRASRQEL